MFFGGGETAEGNMAEARGRQLWLGTPSAVTRTPTSTTTATTTTTTTATTTTTTTTTTMATTPNVVEITQMLSIRDLLRPAVSRMLHMINARLEKYALFAVFAIDGVSLMAFNAFIEEVCFGFTRTPLPAAGKKASGPAGRVFGLPMNAASPIGRLLVKAVTMVMRVLTMKLDASTAPSISRIQHAVESIILFLFTMRITRSHSLSTLMTASALRLYEPSQTLPTPEQYHQQQYRMYLRNKASWPVRVAMDIGQGVYSSIPVLLSLVVPPLLTTLHQRHQAQEEEEALDASRRAFQEHQDDQLQALLTAEGHEIDRDAAPSESHPTSSRGGAGRQSHLNDANLDVTQIPSPLASVWSAHRYHRRNSSSSSSSSSIARMSERHLSGPDGAHMFPTPPDAELPELDRHHHHSRHHSRTHSNELSIPPPFVCSLCHDRAEEPSVLPTCGRVCCYACVSPIVLQTQTCPITNFPLLASDIIRIRDDGPWSS